MRTAVESLKEKEETLLLKEIKELLANILTELKVLNLDESVLKLKIIDVDMPKKLERGKKDVVIDVKERGFLKAIGVVTNSRKALLVIEIDDMKMAGTIEDLYTYGLVGYNPRTFYVTRYDEKNNVYTAWFTPVPLAKYSGKIRFIVYAPQDSDVTYTYSIYRYVFER